MRLCLLILLTLLCGAAHATPATIFYQGRLEASGGGAPITSAVSMTFTFWDAESGGNQLGTFSDNDTVTPDAQGNYNAEIGDIDTNEIPASVFEREPVYLNININGENLAPRKRFGSTGFAMNAARIEGGIVGRTEFLTTEAVNAGDIVVLDAAGKITPARPVPFPSTDVPGFAAPTGMVSLGGNKVLLRSQSQLVVGEVQPNGSVQLGSIVNYGPDTSSGINSNLIFATTDRAVMLYSLAGIPTLATISVNGLTATIGTPLTLPEGVYGIGSLDDPLDVVLVANQNGEVNFHMARVSGSSITLSEPTPSTLGSYSGVPRLISPAGSPGISKKFIAQFYINNGTTLLPCDAVGFQFKVLTGTPSSIPGDYNSGVYNGSNVVLMRAGLPMNFAEIRTLVLTVNGSEITTTGSATQLLSQWVLGRVPQVQSFANGTLFFNTNHGGYFGDYTFFRGPAPLSSVGGVQQTLPIGTDKVLCSTFDNTVTRLVYAGEGANSVDLNKCIGVAEESVGADELCYITVPGGITERFSGLEPGRAYYASANGPAVAGMKLLGYALAPNKLQVWR